MILAIRTDKPEAELYLYDGDRQIDSYSWLAERNLAAELLPKLQDLLMKNSIKQKDLTAIIIYTGSGSFTGLRIGTTVANSLAYSLKITIVEAKDEDWLIAGLQTIKTSKLGSYVVPKYNAEPNITKPKPRT